MSLKYTPVTQSILCLIFFIYVATMYHLTTVDKNLKQFAVYDSDIPVTLKYGQGHQTWYELLEQGFTHAKFERPPLKSVCQNMPITSLEHVQKVKNSVYSLCTWFT